MEISTARQTTGEKRVLARSSGSLQPALTKSCTPFVQVPTVRMENIRSTRRFKAATATSMARPSQEEPKEPASFTNSLQREPIRCCTTSVPLDAPMAILRTRSCRMRKGIFLAQPSPGRYSKSLRQANTKSWTIRSFRGAPANCSHSYWPAMGISMPRLGGGNPLDGGDGLGTIFEISPAGKFTPLYVFCGCGNPASGYNPEGQLFQGTDGNFYGTTIYGGKSIEKFGTVFKLSKGLSPFVETVPTA